MSGLDKPKRIMQILSNRAVKYIVSLRDVELAIFEVVGVSHWSVSRYIEILKKLGWLKRLNRYRFLIGPDWDVEDF